jgi:hypothetical protein
MSQGKFCGCPSMSWWQMLLLFQSYHMLMKTSKTSTTCKVDWTCSQYVQCYQNPAFCKLGLPIWSVAGILLLLKRQSREEVWFPHPSHDDKLCILHHYSRVALLMFPRLLSQASPPFCWFQRKLIAYLLHYLPSNNSTYLFKSATA